MAYTHVVLCALLFCQGAWSRPQSAASTGTQLADDFSKNMAAFLQNVNNGAAKVTTPALQFGLSTIPGLISSGIKTATDSVSKLAGAGRDAAGNVISGAGHVAGGAASVGSALAGGALNVAGSGLGAVTGGLGAAANAGIGFAGKMADSAAAGIKVGGTVGNAALTAAGDGLTLASSGVGVFSNGIGGIIGAVGGLISDRINSTENAISAMIQSGLQNLSSGALNVSTQVQAGFYNALKSFLQILVDMQNLFNSWVTSVAAASSSAASTTSGAISGASGAISSASGSTSGTSSSATGTSS